MKLLNLKLLPRRSMGEGGLNLEHGTLNLRFAIVALVLITCNDSKAQIQQAWVASYNNGITNGTNQAVKMALDTSGNICITGFSQNTNRNLGYATVKYAPNGNQLWAARYDSTNSPLASPVGIELDNSNNVIVTGTGLTIKYDNNGNQLWTAPYAGSSLAIDTDGNVGVTGFGTSFDTVKLSSSGSNMWLQTLPASCEAAMGQALVSDADGNLYVTGSYPTSCESGSVDYELLIIKYGSNGSQIWTDNYVIVGEPVQVEGIAVDGSNNLYCVANFAGGFSHGYVTFKYNASGDAVWSEFPNNNGYSLARGLMVDQAGCVFMTGQIPSNFLPNYSPLFSYGTMKLGTNGSTLWTSLYPVNANSTNVANSLVIDQSDNIYVTGYSPGTNSVNDIVTIKYDYNGNQIWLQRYSSPGTGNAAGNAIAVDKSGNVYVSGYDTTAAGGTEMVLIKYSPVTLQRKPDGTVLLKTQGSPGESFDIEASIDLLNWLDLGTVLADTNGLMMFDDTNAPNFPARFYYTNPQ
jgi:hypothetical protein